MLEITSGDVPYLYGVNMSSSVCPKSPTVGDWPSVVQFLGELAGVCVARWTGTRCDYCDCFRQKDRNDANSTTLETRNADPRGHQEAA